ncbi:unnamed protein product [Acanthoscelides obtectus]|uniref:Uncharacterized protein n=1 Tax=Acanthoscelides obtectus TaxID=200917 RepID=A0A9P0KXC8_ACAOB|nr:unnamed protein product [Acanthoscelides obtectus]CAK1634408.1 hypothetical protein AOBTE_LOCUS8748 [Acanthoscelides obtectus]
MFKMCFRPHDTFMPPHRTRGAKVCELWRGHPANTPTCRFTPRRNLENVDLATVLRSLQQIISPLISATQALQAVFPQTLNG